MYFLEELQKKINLRQINLHNKTSKISPCTEYFLFKIKTANANALPGYTLLHQSQKMSECPS